MKILLTYPYLTGNGGMETVIATLLKSSTEEFDYSLYLPGGSDSDSWENGIEPKRIVNGKQRRTVNVVWNTFRYILKKKPDVVLCMSKPQIFAAWLAKKLLNKKMILISWMHFSLMETKSQRSLKLLKLCDYHFAISSGVQRQLIDLGIKKESTFLVFNPIDKSSLVPRSNHLPWRFIYIGRMQYRGQKNLVDLFTILSEISTDIDWQLDLIGTGPDIDRLREFAKQHHIDSRMVWHGWQNDPWSLVSSADFLFLTSKFEGLGMVLAEAASRGIPTFSANCPVGPEDIINSGTNGILYQPGNLTEAEQQLQAVLSGEKTLADGITIQKSINKFYRANYLRNFELFLTKVMART